MDGELSLLVSVARLSLSYKPRLGRRQQLLARIRRVVCTRHIAEVEIERMRCMHDHVAAIACHQPLAQLCNSDFVAAAAYGVHHTRLCISSGNRWVRGRSPAPLVPTSGKCAPPAERCRGALRAVITETCSLLPRCSVRLAHDRRPDPVARPEEKPRALNKRRRRRACVRPAVQCERKHFIMPSQACALLT
jgi:hypothetical protein